MPGILLALLVLIASPRQMQATQCIAASADLPSAECDAWLDIFDATDGLAWNHCSDNRLDPCECSNVTCANGHITVLQLYSNKLSGSLPSSLDQLTALTDVHLYYNKLVGSIPANLSALTALTNMNLEGNQLTGSIPESLSELTALTEINLSHNYLNGSISGSLSELGPVLTLLSLDHNRLTGTISSRLSKLAKVTYFSLYMNRLTGTIPSSLSQLAAATTISLDNNKLTGLVPPLPFTQYTQFCCLQERSSNTNRFACPLPENISHCVGAPGYKCNTTCS